MELEGSRISHDIDVTRPDLRDAVGPEIRPVADDIDLVLGRKWMDPFASASVLAPAVVVMHPFYRLSCQVSSCIVLDNGFEDVHMY